MTQQYPDGQQPPSAPSYEAPPPFPMTPVPAPPSYTQPQPYQQFTQADGTAYPQAAYGQVAPYQSYGAPYGIDPLTGIPYSDKSKLVAGLLQIFLGGLGIGRFYLGNVGIAIAQIAVTFLTLGFGGLWPLIDGIVLLAGNPRDAQGRPLRP